MFSEERALEEVHKAAGIAQQHVTRAQKNVNGYTTLHKLVNWRVEGSGPVWCCVEGVVTCGVVPRELSCVVLCCDLCALKVKITLCYGSLMRTF